MKQRNTFLKRLLPLALVFAMLLSYFPSAVAADSSTDIQAIAKPQGISIVEDYDDYVGADWVSQLGLPQSVELTLANGTTAAALVTWDPSVIDVRTPGYYSVPGTVALPAGATNGQNLTVAITVQVRKYENLIQNPSFEENLAGWYLRGANPAASQTDLFAADGKYSALLGGNLNYTNFGAADSRNSIITSIPGAGQYYISAKARSCADTIPSGINFQAKMLYKTADDKGNLSGAKTINGEKVAVSNAAFVQSSAITDLPGNTGWIRMDLYLSASAVTNFADFAICLDDVELIPLKYALEVEPSAIQEIKTKLPVRAVIQNYPDYVGANWQTELGLPKSVEVLTDNGNVVNVDVQWDCSNLNFAAPGKYAIVGTLDSAFPNPNNLAAVQIVYVREYKNLLPNPSFEGNLTGWYIRGLNPSAGVTTEVLKHGRYAAVTGAMSTTSTSSGFADTRNTVDQLGAAVALQGEGQYYFSSWARSAAKSNVEGMNHQVRLLYKTMGQDGVLSSSVTKQADKVELNNKEFTQSKAILNMPANTAWVRMDLYVFAKSAADICDNLIYFDHAELIPLNVIVEQYEGSMVQVETVIPSRQIIQNYPDYIGESYTEADLMFPETVKVRSTAGELLDIGVRWDYSTLNLAKVGTYTVYGALEDMKLPNPNGLTVQLKVRVAAKENLFSNPSFEKDGAAWEYTSRISIESAITSPVKDGDFSLLFKAGRLDDVTWNYLQAFYNDGPNDLGLKITKTGGGRYYFGGWAQGTESTNDIQVQLRFLYRSMASGDSAITTRAPSIDLSTTSFTQMGDIITLPDDLYWARMDFYLMGTPEQMRLSNLYLDDFQLLPLNVEIPNLTDIIDCEDVADIYVNAGSSIDGLDLPETLQVAIKSGQKFNLNVIWNTDSFDANQVGEQVITGALVLGKTYKNPKNFVPTARIIVREKGEALRETIYFSTSGDDANDGLSPENPKKDITKIASYLQQGYNVSLKRGDVWYLNTFCFTLSNIHGTEKAPVVVGTYGSGDVKPRISFTMKIEDDAWKLVDEGRNVYAADVSALGSRDGYSVYRCYVNDQSYSVKERNNYVSLKAGEFCSYDNTLYIRMPEGQVPKNVDADPYKVGNRVTIKNVSHLTLEGIHFKGVGAVNNMFYMDAPTKHLKFLHCDMTHVSGHAMQWETADDKLHYKPEIAYCYIDSSISKEEGAIRNGPWACSHLEGITMRDGVDGAWLHHNLMRQFSHCFIAVETLSAANDYTTTGVRNCIIEDNVLEGGYALYARAITLSGTLNLSGVQMCRENIVRRNKCYDMTTSCHLFGENNLIYSNLFSYTHCNYTEDGELFDGKTAQPFAFDTCVYAGKGSVGNMLVNNTFFNVSGAIHIDDIAGGVYNNIYANNLMVNWTSDTANNGGFRDDSLLMQYFMNNGVFSTIGLMDHFVVDEMTYSAADVNNAVAGYSGNICADPKFVDADLSQMQHGARLDFTLSNESPMRYAGLSLYSDVYKIFPMWERMAADYTDLNGVVYLAESPSIGAYSFCERITGDVAEVGKIDSILARPGTLSIDQLNLPDAVPAVNDEGIDVMLLTEWNTEGIDFSKTGTITLTATLRNGPHTDLNINGKVATIDINIKDKLKLLNVTTTLMDETVLFGTSFEDVLKQLPATLDVMEETGYQEALPVTWSCEQYDSTKPDVYTFKCILPEDKISNVRDFRIEVEVRLLHEIGRGTELLVNPDFNDGTSSAPWKFGFGTGTIKMTTDPQYVYPGESSAMIVTAYGRYGSLQQNVLGQIQLMGNGQYLFKMYMRALDPGRPIDSSVACLKVATPQGYTVFTRTKTNIDDNWVEYVAVMDLYDVEDATEIIFHTSTYKSEADVEDTPKSYIISGCSLVYLGDNTKDVTATTDSLGLDWNAIRGENVSGDVVSSKLNLPTTIVSTSTIVWSSSNEEVVSVDGAVTMGRTPRNVTLTATITHTNGVVTTKKFAVTVPRSPDLPEFTASLSGDQSVKIGEEFKVTISVNSANVTAFNVFRFTISFNASNLEYVGISDDSVNVEIEGGRLVFSGSGAERPITDTFTLTFKAKKSAMTEIKLALAELDLSDDGDLNDLPTMTVKGNAALIDVAKVDKVTDDDNADSDQKSDSSAVVWIVIGIAAVILIAGGVIAVVLIKKKQNNAM